MEEDRIEEEDEYEESENTENVSELKADTPPDTPPENVVVVDYRGDVIDWMQRNNKELQDIEESVQGLIKAFKYSVDFYDGLRRLDANSDMGRVFLELLTRFMGKYERADDTHYKEEVIDYIRVNTKELSSVQERINYLLKAFDYAEDFIYGLERIEPVSDLSVSFVEILSKFVERGLSDD